MQRICIAAILAAMMSASAGAQSLRPSYAPDGTSQSSPHAPKPAPRQVVASPQREAAPVLQTYAPPQPPPASGIHDFFAAIFAGPIMLAHGFRPAGQLYDGAPLPNATPGYATPGYATPGYATPGYATTGYAPQAYATPGQTNAADYSIDPKYLRQQVVYSGGEAPGTIIVDTPNKFLYLVEDGGKALRYGIGVGRPGFLWSGVKTVTAKREWPDWRPPAEMIARRPDLPRYMPGGIENPLGARALYLGSSLYRIHGSNEPWTIGTNVSSGCIRMRNDDVTDLYERVKIGAKVVVI
jgi:lipoprotein-anchoring transpeptidase ErfK/SrfK